MPTITCPTCKAPFDSDNTRCPKCGNAATSVSAGMEAPIRRLSGKLAAVGTVVLAAGVVSTILGAWWGPALLFPGAIILALGKFL